MEFNFPSNALTTTNMTVVVETVLSSDGRDICNIATFR